MAFWAMADRPRFPRLWTSRAVVRQIMGPSFRTLIVAKNACTFDPFLADPADVWKWVRNRGSIAAIRVRKDVRHGCWMIDHDFARISRRPWTIARQIIEAALRYPIAAKDA